MYVIRKRIKLPAEKAIFIFVDEVRLSSPSSYLAELSRFLMMSSPCVYAHQGPSADSCAHVGHLRRTQGRGRFPLRLFRCLSSSPSKRALICPLLNFQITYSGENVFGADAQALEELDAEA